MPAQILVPRQVVFPRRGVVAEVALVLLQLAAVNTVYVLFEHYRVRSEVAPGALVALVVGDLRGVPAQLLVPVQVVLP